MNVLFICGVFAEQNESEIINNTKGCVEFSSNVFQKLLISGFKKNNINIRIISAPFIGAYPFRYKSIRFSGFSASQNEYEYVKFNNIWGLRHRSRANHLKKAIKSHIKRGESYDLIIVYSAHEPFLEAGIFAKHLCPSAKICYIVPDLPQFMNLNVNRTRAYDFFKFFDIININNLTKHVDSFVILTEQMKDFLNVGNRPYLVVEGIIESTPTEIHPPLSLVDGIKRIVYTGKMNIKFGVKELVDSFMRINSDNLRLVLCGDGDARDYIIEKNKIDHRIEFKGQVTYNLAKEWIYKADVLVNPRPNNEEYTKYSFPSKNIEYLLSGKPVVAYMLSGMPRIYESFLYTVDDSQSLKDAIINALSQGPSEDKFLLFTRYSIHLLAENVAKRIVGL